MRVDQTSGADVASEPDATLDWAPATTTEGTACALLTPAIKAKLREMAGGQTLEVRVSDASAKDDIAAWCRLSGHTLLAVIEEPTQALRVYLRKKGD
ncbi:MAG: sulfurtransferase TusA family protein [Ktedonobacterales bacterium]